MIPGGDCCIIATCALPEQHPDLEYLRHFRDRVLRRSPAGRIAIWLYYAAGSPIAALICVSKDFKRLVAKRFIPFLVKVARAKTEGER